MMMAHPKKSIRLIARLDIKTGHLVKGIQLEGLRKLGRPEDFAFKYYKAGIDELLYIDIVASLYQRNNLLDIVRDASRNIFVPITVGGGLRTIDDAMLALRAGADKVAINTGAIRNPSLITEVAERFGSQCMVLSIQAKRHAPGQWEAYCDNGREHTHLDAIAWAERACALGAGEILVTSVDREGTAKGFDVDLVRAIADVVPIPVIAGGGMGGVSHIVDVVRYGCCDAVAMAHVLHYGKLTVPDLRLGMEANGLAVRRVRGAMEAEA